MHITIVTGASQNHIRSLYQFISSIQLFADLDHTVIIYDLGCSPVSIQALKEKFPLYIFRTFDYSKYPEFYNIEVNCGQYAWKSACIKECLLDAKDVLFWGDAGTKITHPLSTLYNVIKHYTIYSLLSSNHISDKTHSDTFKYFGNKQEHKDTIMLSGGVQGYDLYSEDIIDFIYNLASLCSQENIIAPPGSNRDNHRQDQSIFSILYYEYAKTHKLDQKFNFRFFAGYSIHNDVEDKSSTSWLLPS